MVQGIADGACDCNGTLPNENFDCAGNCLLDTDCAGTCGGDAVVDECGVCDGSGIADGACDCNGTLPNENFDCDGNCLVEVDCMGVCGGDGGTYNGDANGDGLVNVTDVVLTVGLIINGNVFTDYDLCTSDLNQDGLQMSLILFFLLV